MRIGNYLLPVIIFMSTTACDNKALATADNESALHAVSGEKLRIIMQTMKSSASRDIGTQDKQLDKISEEQMADLTEAVEELLFHAELLSVGEPGVYLDASEMVTFRALAGQLYTEVLNIKQLTEYYDYHTMEPAYERLNQTCIACHSLFREK